MQKNRILKNGILKNGILIKSRQKKRSKRLCVSIAAAALLLLGGCGGPDGEQAGTAGKEQEDYVYVAEYQSLDDICDTVATTVLGNDGNVYFTGIRDKEDVFFAMKIGEDDAKEVPLGLEKGMHVSAMGKDTEGNLLLGLIRYEGDPESGGTLKNVAIQKISPEGEKLEFVDTGNAFLKKDSSSFYISDLLQDKEGNYYICSGKDICVLRSDGSIYFEIPIGQYVNDMFAMKDGSVVVAYYGNTGWSLEVVDFAQKSLKPLESSIVFDYGTYLGGTETDLLYTQNAILYTCNLGDEKPTALLNWMDSDINSSNLQDFTILPDGRIAAVTIDYSAGAEMELSVLTKKNRSEVPEKQILTYASLYVPYYTENDIVAFNKQSDKYRIEVKEYGDDTMDYADRMSLLNTDLTSGNGPDIIDLSYCPLSLSELVDAGVVEDLTPYLEADDTLKREDMVENVMRAYEQDGGLYGIMSCFGIESIIGKVSDVGDQTTWSIEDMMALVDSKGKDVEIIEYMDKSYMLTLLCMMNQNLFIDKEAGTCDFTSGEFAKMLEFANRFPKEVDYNANGPSEIEKIRNGQLVLISRIITSVSLYQMYEYEFGEPVNFIGYPTFEGSGLLLSSNGTTVAMHAGSKNKDGVWEFIRFNLSEKRQENLPTANGGFPILKSALDKELAEAMEDEYYEDEDGNQKLTSKATWSTGDFSVEVYAATQEQVDRIREMIDTAQPNARADQKISEIINEEAQAYFDGQKSMEDVAALVQNRVQTYLSETK